MKPTFTAGEASRLAGFSKPWMLGHLEREQIFVREHASDRRPGRARKYTFTDIVVLRSINRMLQLGARPARIKRVIRSLGKLDGLNRSRREAQALVRKIGSCLFVSDKEALILDSQERVVDLLKEGQFAFCFMIDFQNTVLPVSKVMRSYERKRIDNWKSDHQLLEDMCRAAGF